LLLPLVGAAKSIEELKRVGYGMEKRRERRNLQQRNIEER
jgi:hypothetical protein